jgi:hypothetical protein
VVRAVAEAAAVARPVGVVTPGAHAVVALGAAEALMRTLPLGHAVEEQRLDLARVLGVMVLLPLVVVAAAGLGLALGFVAVVVAMMAGVRLVVRMVRVKLMDLVVRTVAVAMAHEVVMSGLGLALGAAEVVRVRVRVRLVVRMVRAVVAAEVVAVRAVVASKVAVRAVMPVEAARRRQQLSISGAGCLPLAPQEGCLLGEVDVAVPLGHELPASPLGCIEALLVESLLQLLRGLFVLGRVLDVSALVRAVGRFLGVLGGQEQAQGLALEGVEGVAQLLIGREAHAVFLVVEVAQVELVTLTQAEGLPHLALELGEAGAGADHASVARVGDLNVDGEVVGGGARVHVC